MSLIPNDGQRPQAAGAGSARTLSCFTRCTALLILRIRSQRCAASSKPPRRASFGSRPNPHDVIPGTERSEGARNDGTVVLRLTARYDRPADQFAPVNVVISMPQRFALILALILALSFSAASAHAACINVKEASSLSFQGALAYRIFAGPPNYEDVRKGDTPEPAYILTLNAPICAAGDEFLNPQQSFDKIQVYPAESDGAGHALWRDLRQLVGKRVYVEGKSAFGAHTGHHHAPLQLPITRIAIAFDPTKAYGTAMTTVQAFYLALGAADGEEASKFVIPEKRSSGPLSASAISNFYGKLIVPLSLVDIVAMGSDQFRVRYSYIASGTGRCNGESIVQTIKVNGMNLIQSIKAASDC